MTTFMDNFTIFLTYFLQAMGNIYNWFIGTIVGQITIFIIIISHRVSMQQQILLCKGRIFEMRGIVCVYALELL